MTIDKKTNGTELEITLTGRLDTTTAPMLETEVTSGISGIEKLILNFENLEYISSAGLRVILAAQKIMNEQGKMIIRNAGSGIMEVFEITGFLDILTIE